MNAIPSMTTPPPTSMRAGEYVLNFPVERAGDTATARDAMRRNGCKCIRFERTEVMVADEKGVERPAKRLVAHGYVGRVSGPGVEEL